MWSPETDEELLAQTIEVVIRLNIIGVLSGPEPKRIAEWEAAAPGPFIPGLVLEFGDTGGSFSPDSLRRLHGAGRLAVLADDAIAINVVGDQHTGGRAIAAFYRQLFGDLLPSDLGPRRCQEATTQMIGDDVAIVTQECTWYDVIPEEEAEGRRLPIRHSRVTHVLADRGEGWRIVAFRNIPIWSPFAWEGPNHPRTGTDR